MLVTTHWPSSENKKDTLSREKQLKSEFWKTMIKRGSRDFQHEGSVKSAQNIAEQLINSSPIVPKINDALVRWKLRFNQTEAGKMVSEDLKVFGAEMKDEINSINGCLEAITREKKEAELKAQKEKELLEKQLREALQEVAYKDATRKEMQALNEPLKDEQRERTKEIQALKTEGSSLRNSSGTRPKARKSFGKHLKRLPPNLGP